MFCRKKYNIEYFVIIHSPYRSNIVIKKLDNFQMKYQVKNLAAKISKENVSIVYYYH